MEETESMILGVCKTLEEETGVNAWIYRVIIIILTSAGGGGILIYSLLALIM